MSPTRRPARSASEPALTTESPYASPLARSASEGSSRKLKPSAVGLSIVTWRSGGASLSHAASRRTRASTMALMASSISKSRTRAFAGLTLAALAALIPTRRCSHGSCNSLSRSAHARAAARCLPRPVRRGRHARLLGRHFWRRAGGRRYAAPARGTRCRGGHYSGRSVAGRCVEARHRRWHLGRHLALDRAFRRRPGVDAHWCHLRWQHWFLLRLSRVDRLATAGRLSRGKRRELAREWRLQPHGRQRAAAGGAGGPESAGDGAEPAGGAGEGSGEGAGSQAAGEPRR